jgi:hypothetical protein
MSVKRKNIQEDDRAFHMRMPRDTWLLLKKAAMISEISMGEYVTKLVEKERVKLTKKMDVLGDFADVE